MLSKIVVLHTCLTSTFDDNIHMIVPDIVLTTSSDLDPYNSETSWSLKFGREILHSLMSKYLKFGTERPKHV